MRLYDAYNRPLAGRYRLHELLGEGGMAVVHRAQDEETGAWCAIKLISPQMVQHLQVQQRFLREADVLARLNHPNIVRIHGVHQEEGMGFLVMELVEGRSLYDWMFTHGPMPPAMAVAAVQQVCAAVEAAHQAGVIHRDLKPSNVLVGPDGSCKVVDFGIARALDAGRLTRTGMTMGTWGYMAPEQQADATRVDHRADIYSLGAMLLSLIAARIPDPIEEVLAVVATPEPLLRVINRATLRQPPHRYADVPALRAALNRLELPPDPPETPPLHLPLQTVARAGPTLINL